MQGAISLPVRRPSLDPPVYLSSYKGETKAGQRFCLSRLDENDHQANDWEQDYLV